MKKRNCNLIKKLSVVIWLLFIINKTNAQNFEWAFKIGGSNEQYVSRVCVDQTGDIIVSGVIYGTTDFDPSSAAVNINMGNAFSKAYVAKYSSSGSFKWVKIFFVASENISIANISCDADINIIFSW